eukprot:4962539-Ditylum_brightwellii.AAC.1
MDRNEQNEHLVCNEDDDVDNGANDGDDGRVDDGAEGADKYLVHLSQVADCCRTDRHKQNEHLVCNADSVVDYGANDGVDDGVDDGAKGAKKHLIHLSQVADCCKMERRKLNKHAVCNEADDVDDGDDDGDEDDDDGDDVADDHNYDSVGNGGDDGGNDGADGADNHLVHFSQVADCCRIERNEQNKHLVCDKDDNFDDDDNDGDYDSVGNGDDDSVDDGAEGADKHL